MLSFWLRRDTEKRPGGRFYAWPTPVRRYLNGTVSVSVADPADGRTWARTDAVLGTGEGAIRIADRAGNRLALDKSGRLTRLFGDRDSALMIPVLDAMDAVLEALERAGVAPFLAYGTLLGAVRDQDFIAHDSDADLGYLSRHDNPAEASLESFALQRRLQALGYRVERYSGLAFKVVVREADGTTRGLDVFGGFIRAGILYLMGEVGVAFEERWLHPRSRVRLAGRAFPAPAVPERLLEAMYGAGWRVPDPAFRFETPAATVRRLDGWFRGMRAGYQERWTELREGAGEPARLGPSSFVRWVRSHERRLGLAVDVGCGVGSDALWLARRGVPTVGLDYFPHDLRHAARRARVRVRRGRLDRPPEFEWANVLDLRSVMVTGARLVRRPGPRIVLARHLADATTGVGRENLLRLARMITRGGGRLYLQVQVAPTPKAAILGVRALDPDALRAQIVAGGGRMESMMVLSELDDGPAHAGPGNAEPSLCRMVVSW